MAASTLPASRKESHETFAIFAQPALDDRVGDHADRAVTGDVAVVVVSRDDGSLSRWERQYRRAGADRQRRLPVTELRPVSLSAQSRSLRRAHQQIQQPGIEASAGWATISG